MAIISWLNHKESLDDHRELLGYLIYYKKATGNVSMFDGRDACTDTEWYVIDYEANEDLNNTQLNATLDTRTPTSRLMTIVPGLDPC